MVVTKDELIASLQHEVRVLLHLASKVDPARLYYRPTPKQHSTLELLQYLTIMGPTYLGTIKAGVFEMNAWRDTWRTEETAAKAMNLEQTRTSIARQTELLLAVVCSYSCVARPAAARNWAR